MNIIYNMLYAVENRVINLNEAKLNVFRYSPEYIKVLIDLNEDEFVEACQKILANLKEKYEIPKLSIIYSVLDSHEIVRKQCHYLSNIISYDTEVIIVDDGSTPPLELPFKDYRFRLYRTNNFSEWTQPAAKNLAAVASKAKILLFADIDHFFTPETLEDVLKMEYDLLRFKRRLGALTDECDISTAKDFLIDLGADEEYIGKYLTPHLNTFAISRDLFINKMRGYDLDSISNYGLDDTLFPKKYDDYAAVNDLKQAILSDNHVYVYPNPSRNIELFHDQKRVVKQKASSCFS